MRREKANVSLS